MRLTQARPAADPSAGWGSLPAFRRLDPASAAPIAVAVSGGGDSLAALIHACAWAEAAGREVLALCVDHRLQPASGDWTAFAGECARALGARFQALAWTGEKPASGLAAAARAARHSLLAEAARQAGCTVIVTGHTADDQAENAALGQGRLAEWSPSPVWPQGRDIFLLRPLLALARADIRIQLAAAGWRWIDDPANLDLRHPRARARMAGLAPLQAEPEPPPAVPQAEDAGGGALRLPRAQLTAKVLAAAALSAGGGARPPRRWATERLLARAAAGEDFVATLAGARIALEGEAALFSRELGRAAPPVQPLRPHEPVVWDGRFEIMAAEAGLAVRAAGGLAAKLPLADRRYLRRIAAPARAATPVLQRPDGGVFSAIAPGDDRFRARALVRRRFLSACNAFNDERQACDDLCMEIPNPRPYLGGLGPEGGFYEPA